MTDLLSAEDIKKAIGAFAGESALPSPSSPFIGHLRPCAPRPATGQISAATAHASAGRWRGPGGVVLGVSQTPPAAGTWGGLCGGEAGCPTAAETYGRRRADPGPRAKTGVEGGTLGVLARSGGFLFKARGGDRRRARLPSKGPLSGPPFWTRVFPERRRPIVDLRMPALPPRGSKSFTWVGLGLTRGTATFPLQTLAQRCPGRPQRPLHPASSRVRRPRAGQPSASPLRPPGT